jgi:Zn-dependent M32 family carboxypeptidase
MFGLIKGIIKFSIIAVVLFGISQIEIKNRKLYFHAEAFYNETFHKYSDKFKAKFINSIKEEISKYLKDKISKVFEEDKNYPHKSKLQIPTFEDEMDEKKLQSILDE